MQSLIRLFHKHDKDGLERGLGILWVRIAGDKTTFMRKYPFSLIFLFLLLHNVFTPSRIFNARGNVAFASCTKRNAH
jgi:hypothetical protein